MTHKEICRLYANISEENFGNWQWGASVLHNFDFICPEVVTPLPFDTLQFARAYFLQIVIGSDIHLSIWFFVVYSLSGAKPGANHNVHRESSPTCFGNTTACLAKRYWLNLKPEISYSKPVDFVDWKAGCTLTRSFHYPSSHNKHTFPLSPPMRC